MLLVQYFIYKHYLSPVQVPEAIAENEEINVCSQFNVFFAGAPICPVKKRKRTFPKKVAGRVCAAGILCWVTNFCYTNKLVCKLKLGQAGKGLLLVCHRHIWCIGNQFPLNLSQFLGPWSCGQVQHSSHPTQVALLWHI